MGSASTRVGRQWGKPFQCVTERFEFRTGLVHDAFHRGQGGVGGSGADASAEAEEEGEHVADGGRYRAIAGAGIKGDVQAWLDMAPLYVKGGR